MSGTDRINTRLCLVTPSDCDPARFASLLADAFAGGDVASLIVTAEDAATLPALARFLIPVAQRYGVAIIIHGDAELARQSHADGVHVDARGAALAAARRASPSGIVGAADLRTRHDAMLAGEANADYVFFGRLDGDTAETIYPKAFDLAEWWASLFEIPAIVMGGLTIASVTEARDAGIEFVALRRAVWEHPNGPGAAVAEANRLLAASGSVSS